MKIVVVGGQIAGSTFAYNYKKDNPNDEVTIINKNIHFSYIPSALPYYIKNDISEESLILYSEEEFTNLGINLYLKSEVISVSPEDKEIKIIKGDSGNINIVPYDKLIIASGCNSIKLPELENKGDNIFILKNILNAKRLKEYIENSKPKKALIVGGGVSGVEIAKTIKEMGIDVLICEKEDRILKQFEKNIGNFAKEELEKNGTQIYLKSQIKSAERLEDGRLNISFGGSNHIFDFIIVTTGVVPNTLFLKNANINMTENGYIFVNENFETSIQDIYAIGDIAIVKTKGIEEYILPKLASAAKNQAEFLNEKLKGKMVSYEGTTMPILVNIGEKELGKVGINSRQAEDNNSYYINITLTEKIYPKYILNKNEQIYISAIFDNKFKFLGVEMIGNYLFPLLNYFSAALKGNFTAQDFLTQELVFDPKLYKINNLINVIGKEAINKINELN